MTFALSSEEESSNRQTIHPADIPGSIGIQSGKGSSINNKDLSALEELCGIGAKTKPSIGRPHQGVQDRVFVNKDLLKDLFHDQTEELEKSLKRPR